MDEFYKSYYIRTLVDLSLDNDCWVPKVEIIWEEQGAPRRKQLAGPNNFFKILENAEIYALEMGRGWIDDDIKQRSDAMAAGNAS